MKSDVRAKSLNGMRQIIDAAASFQGLLWVFTGTPEFFDTNRGVKGLAPLFDRIQLRAEGGFASVKQPQLKLKPFRKPRLKEVSMKLRSLFPTKNREEFERRMTPADLDSLVDEVSDGLHGDVGVVPPQFLRRVVSVFDVVEEQPDFVLSPGKPVLTLSLTLEEENKQAGKPAFTPEPGYEKGYEVMNIG